MAGKKIDINSASLDELEQLVGVGRWKAEAIVSQRRSLGGFTSINDLKNVPRLGNSVVEQNRQLLLCRPQVQGSRRCSRVKRREHGKGSLNKTDGGGTETTPPTRIRCHSSTNRGKTTLLPRSLRQDGPEERLETNTSLSRTKPDTSNVAGFGEDITDKQESTVVCKSEVNVGREEEEENYETDKKRHSSSESGHLSSSGSSGHLYPYRSRIPVPITMTGKHMMKRKSNILREESGISPGKKLCRAQELQSSGSQTLGSLKLQWSSSKGNALQRRRIPSKENPPPEMADWLKTFQAWSNPERRLALDELIALCEPTQVRHIMQVIEPQFQRDFISLLPKELALYVLSYLEPKDLLRAAQTCCYWRILAEDKLLWKEKCREEGIESLGIGRIRRRSSQGSPRSPWKALYMRQHQIEQNWRSGPIRTPKMLKGHDDHVITCLEFCGNRIVSGSDDNTLKVWSAITGKCLRTLVGHTGGVWASQMSGNIIISGSTDRTLKVWNADTGHCTHTLYGHTSTVRCMHLHDNKVVSGSRDATLRVWDIDTGQCLHVLMGHVAAVRCVQYDGRRVVSGAYDYMVKVWDPETETCLHSLQGHTNRVYSLQFDSIHIVSGSLDTSIRVWDVETGTCLHTLIGHQSLTSGMELKENILVSGNADSTVKVWDIRTGRCLQTLQGPNKHQSAVTCLQFNKKFVITSSDDGTVKIWDLRTGEFLRNLVALESGGSGGVVWRVRCTNTKLVCAVGSRNGTEETKLLVLDFDVDDKKMGI